MIVGGSDHPEEYQHQDNNQHRAETAAGEVAPVDTMWPNRQDTDQQQHDDDQKKCAHDRKCLAFQHVFRTADGILQLALDLLDLAVGL